jgi:hypothetical protein
MPARRYTMKHAMNFEKKERRARTRDPIRLKVRYRTLGRASTVTGVGETINFSSHGILVSAQHRPGVGARLEAIVEWPIRLNGTTIVELITLGRVERSGPEGFAVSVDKHKFQPARKPGIFT